MIFDMTQIILQYSLPYTRITNSTFIYNGLTYTQAGTSTTIRGVLNPLTSEDRIELLGLGHSINGKKVFYLPVSEGILTEKDVIEEPDGTRWIVEPHDSNWKSSGGYIKYRLTRDVSMT